MNEQLKQLLEMDVSKYTEKKGKFTYLSWAFAWKNFLKVYPEATYAVLKDENNNAFFGNKEIGYMVYTTVTVGELTHEMWLPVMDFKNQAMKTPTMMDINKAIMRCLVKNLGMFGLGLYIYAGEDLPEVTEEPITTDMLLNIAKEKGYDEAFILVQAEAESVDKIPQKTIESLYHRFEKTKKKA